MPPGDPNDPNQSLDLTATTQTAEEAADSLETFTGAATQAGTALGAMNNISEAAGSVFQELESRVNAFGFSLKNTGSLTQVQTAQFSLLTTAVLGARKAFDNLANIDSTGLHTFTGSFQELQKIMASSPALSIAGSGIKMVSDMLTKMGAPMNEVQDKARKGMGALMEYGQAFFTSADNGLRLQNVYLQLAAKTGNLGEVFRQAGSDLSNINSILSVQNKMIGETATATNLTNEQVENYYALLGQVPKAIESTVTSMDGSNETMSMLTATIKAAAGTGRKYEEVVKDLHDSFKNYGIAGEDALKFTNRFSEISNKFGIELDDVKSGIMGATGAFKGMTDAGAASARMTEAVTGMMNDYVEGLKKAGMTGPEAIATVTSLTNGVKSLSTAQKAFLSAQTGGPGGLMGSFQIEKMLREGKIDEVFDKVRGTMQKQFGKIVTLDEATKSPEAASQLQRQMLMLKQGPMGSMVKTDQDAYRLLETFRAKQEGRAPADQGAKGLDPKGLQKSIDVGTEFEKKSYTQLDVMRQHLESIRRSADVTNLNLVQKGNTAGVGQMGFLGTETANQRAVRQNISATMSEASQRGGQTAADYAHGMKPGQEIMDQSGAAAANAMNDFSKWTKQIKGSAGAIADTLKQAMGGSNKDFQSQVDKLNADIKAKRDAAASKPLAERQKMLAEAQREEDVVKGAQKFREQYGNIVKPQPTGAVRPAPGAGPTTGAARLGPLPTQGVTPPGAAVGAAPRNQPVPRRPGGPGGAGAGPTPDVHVTEQGSGGRIKVDVHVNVKDAGGQAHGTTPAINSTP